MRMMNRILIVYVILMNFLRMNLWCLIGFESMVSVVCFLILLVIDLFVVYIVKIILVNKMNVRLEFFSILIFFFSVL